MFDDRTGRYHPDDTPFDACRAAQNEPPPMPRAEREPKGGGAPWFWIIVIPVVCLFVFIPQTVTIIGRGLGYLLFIMMIVWIARLFRG